nr:hypothetical protein PHYPA_022274 [Physcomitrium patens]
MMVVSLGGVLHAVNPVTKKTLWSFASGPEVSTTFMAGRDKETKEINSSLDVVADDGLNGETEDWSMFSGPDGKLYVHDKNGIAPLQVSIKDLVASSPHHTDDGAVVLSSVSNTAFLLNKDTGALIRKFDNSGKVLEKAATFANEKAKAEDAELLLEQTSATITDSEKKVNTMLCLRTDYSVTVQELATGKVRWNVSLGEVKTLSLVQSSGQSPTFRQAYANENGTITTPVLAASMSSPRPSYQVAPIAIFSSSGEYIGNLLPATPSPLDWKSNFPGKVAFVRRVKPIPNDADSKRILPVLADVQKDFLSGGFPGKQAFAGVPSLDNRSADHRSGSVRAGRDTAWAWGSVAGIVLLVSGFLSFLWYLYNRSSSGKREEVVKIRKAGANKTRRKVKKGTPSTANKGPSEDDGNNEITHSKQRPSAEASAEGTTRGVAMNKSAYGDGIQVGRLFVTKVVIGAGSNGTSVFEGYLDGRHVAVKRLLAHHYDKAVKEIKFLITSDEHPNVVRYFAMEETPDFVYVALERCALSLNDLIVSESKKNSLKHSNIDDDSDDVKYLKLPNGKELKLWNYNGRCSPQLLQLMRDIVAGLAHLHAVGIVHRDLKPHNVLVSNGRILQAKLADMGLSKHLANDVSSYQDTGKGGSGSRGWQAPEQLKEGRQTRAVDVFSLGCLFFFCITGGQHPFGEHFLRDANIAKGAPDFFYIEDMPEAYHLIKALLCYDPSKRPAAKDVMLHPFFWNSEQRLSFLLKASDRVEHEDRVSDSQVLPALEAIGPDVFGHSWETKLDSKLLDDGRRYRKYNFSSTRDLLRIIRNKSHHFLELPQDMQESLGPFPEGFETYFSNRFPRLLMEVYKVLHDYCKDEPTFKRYFEVIDEV